MGKPDALSCWADQGSGSGDNENMILLTPDFFCHMCFTGLRSYSRRAGHLERYPEGCSECRERGGGSQGCKGIAENIDTVYKIDRMSIDRQHPILLGEDIHP